MEIRSIIARKNYFRLLRYYYFRRRLAAKIIIPLSVVCLVSFNMSYLLSHPALSFIIIFVILIILSFVFVFLTPYLIGKRKTLRRLRRQNQEILNFSFEKDGFHIGPNAKSNFITWKQVQLADEFWQDIFIRVYDGNFYLLPSASFTSDRVKKDFLQNLKSQIINHRDHNVYRMYRKGWLGLIPLIGAFVGLWLMIEGIFRFRDRKLLLIGIASIMFTVFVYGSLFYYSEYSKQYRINAIPLTKDLLKKTVIEIEFYKSQKGVYPERLEDLKNTDSTVFIEDPIMQGKDNVTKGKFFYKRIGVNYTLFSCGVDMRPFTADDIYPSIDTSSSNKIGLIRGQ